MPVVLRWLLRLGPLNPIAVRLVQGGSRRRRHLYIRAVYLGALILALLYLLLYSSAGGTLSYRDMASAAAGSFEFTAYLQIALICLLAPVFMAGAIAQEANPRTWDILLTTPLSAGEIVLGNLFGRLFFILALLFSSLPLFALTQYFGGVPGSSIFASYAIAASAALLVGALAIALSVSRLVGKRAVFAFYISVVSYLAVTLAVDYVRPARGTVSYMTAINPFLALNALLDPTGYRTYEAGSQVGLASWMLERPVATWCLASTLISLVLMGASTLTVRAGGIAGLGGQGGRGGVPWYRKMFGLSAKGSEHRAPRAVWSNPIAWREAAARNATLGRMAARWSFIALGGLWAVGFVVYYHFSSPAMTATEFQTIVSATTLGELGVVTLVALQMSATGVAREREDGTLDLLLTTPITPAAYLGGKVRGMVAYLLPLIAVPVGTLLVAGLYVLLVEAGALSPAAGLRAVELTHTPPTSGSVASPPFQVPAVLPEAAVIAAVVTVPFIAACCMIGLQRSLQSKGSIGAVVATVGIIGVVAGIAGVCAFKSGSTIPMVGPALAALTPATAVYASIDVREAMYSTLNGPGLESARLSLFFGAVLAGGAFIGVVYGLRSAMVHNFDMTVRRLAGTA
jgi:ABC-type transport system involved in multi-copper enzyme maturation permease subunit